MTHTQTQGADGAGTKTAKPGDLLYRSEWETKRTITHEDAREIAGRLIASRFRRTDCETARASIPANPDYDDDLLINSYIKQQARKDAALAAPAPAATPGVPDSLRALSEAATKGEWVFERMHDDFVGVYSDDRTGSVIANFAGFHAAPRPKTEQDANARLAAEAVNHVRALIAAQPAGQAGDAGAGDAEQRKELERQIEFSEGCIAGKPGYHMAATKEQARKHLAYLQGKLAKLTPASNSTRTGAAGTGAEEADASVPSHILAMAQAMADGRARAWESMRYGACVPQHHSRSYWVMLAQDAYAALAARPEAPSDAGWRERVRHVKRGTEYEVLGEAEMQVAVSTGWRHFPTGVDLGDAIPARLTHDGCKVTVYRGSDGKLWCRFTNEFRDGRFETITQPSDPAPSGQAEG